MHSADAFTSELDDSTVAYVLAVRKAFDDLRQVASQLAGLLVLNAAGAKSAGPHHPMLALAGGTLQEAADAARQATPGARARDHHRHLLQAVAAFESAFAAAACRWPAGGRSVDSVLVPLRVGYAQLQEAAGLLPGFDLIAFGQGCCGTGQVGQVRQVEE